MLLIAVRKANHSPKFIDLSNINMLGGSLPQDLGNVGDHGASLEH